MQSEKDCDHIRIDCMPSMGLTVINALSAADRVIILTQSYDCCSVF
ncbi:MAG: ParA family protein [Butyricicoccus sp.]